MNHRPFEDWLLNDTPMTVEQKRELDAHMRSCTYCKALAETGVALRSVKKVSPPAGFSTRFQARLAERKLAERRRRLWGAILFTFGGLALLAWFTFPYLVGFFASPAAFISALVEWGIFLITTFEALTQAGSVLVNILPGFLPPFAWMILISTVAGIILLWSVSIWRFSRASQGA